MQIQSLAWLIDFIPSGGGLNRDVNLNLLFIMIEFSYAMSFVNGFT